MKFFWIAILVLGSSLIRAEAKSLNNLKVIPAPSAANSMTPFLLKDGNTLWMTWTEMYEHQNVKGKRIRIAKWEAKSNQNGQWSSPKTVVDTPEIMANWADFPSLQKGGDGHLYIHWLKTASKKNPYAYYALVTRSKDNGKTWKNIGILHQDRNETAEHGFVSMVPTKSGVRAFWLDGGNMTGHGGAMHLKTALVNQKISNETIVDERVCSCCGTAGASIDGNPIIFYRSRSNKEIRDIYSARLLGKTWKTTNVSLDNWEIHGCPVNGPDVDSRGKNLALIWYSGGGNQPGVNLRFSKDGGHKFGKAIPVDDFLAGSLGRAQVLLLNGNEAMVTWMKSKPDGKADLYARRIRSDGRMGSPVVVSEIGSSRGVGFPQMKIMKKKVILAWTAERQKEYDIGGIKIVSFKTSEIPLIMNEMDETSNKVKFNSSAISKGEYIPEVSAVDINGKKVSLSTYRGKTILLNYWASWCDACIEEFRLINEFEAKYSKKGLKIILVNIDTPEDWPKAKKLVEEAKLKPTVWRDSKNNGAAQFGYAALPYTAIIDSQLKLRSSMTGSLLPKRSNIEKRIKSLLRIK